MHIAKLELHNWGPFRGRQVLDLDAVAYAVTARYKGNEEQSNTAGKTTLLEAIRFALYGGHSWRYEDDWVTEGEEEGEVALVLSSGQRISRKRRRGGSTKLTCSQREIATGAEAQKLIEAKVGLKAADFTTCYIAQRQAASFITGDPAARTKLVSSWLGLDKLEACVVRVREMAKGVEGDLRVERAERSRAETAKIMALASATMGDLEAEFSAAEARVEELEDHFARAMRSASAATDAETWFRYWKVVEEGKKLAAQLEAIPDYEVEDLRRRRDASFETRTRAIVERDEKARLCKKFDGRCPVAGFECPERERIDGMVVERQRALEAAQVCLDAEQEAFTSLEDSLRMLEEVAKGKAELKASLEHLRQRARELVPGARRYQESRYTGEPVDLEQIRQQSEAVSKRSWELRQRLLSAGAARHEEEVHTIRIAELERELATAQEAVQVFKAAQRRVAEDALVFIEGRANNLLDTTGVGHSLTLTWEREGSGLATECRECGWEYPQSAKVRSCGACGASRGPKVIRQLEAVLGRPSDGAASDLAGVALSLAAACWLRGERGAQWGTVVLDEAFSQCDRAARRAMSGHLGGMLKEAGFEQAFVVSHSPDTLGALPGRIEIESDGDHAKVEVK